MSGDRFVAPEPSDSAMVRAYRDHFLAPLLAQQVPGELRKAIAAAYAVDLPAIVEAEVELAFRAQCGGGGLAHDGWCVAYLRERFGPEPAIVSSSRLNCTCLRPSEKYTGDCPVHPAERCGEMGFGDTTTPLPRDCTHPKDHAGPHSWEPRVADDPDTPVRPVFTPDERAFLWALAERESTGYANMFTRAKIEQSIVDAARKLVNA